MVGDISHKYNCLLINMLIKTQKCHIADIQSYEQIYEQSMCKPIKFLLFITQTHTNQILNSPNIAQHISLWGSQSAEKTMKLINEARIPDIKKDNSPDSQAINSIYIYDPFFEYLESFTENRRYRNSNHRRIRNVQFTTKTKRSFIFMGRNVTR